MPADSCSVERVARVSLWRAASEQCPPESFEIVAELGTPEVWFVPTVNDDGLVKFPHCPIRYPVSQIEGYVTG